jgi:hypothetical protein
MARDGSLTDETRDGRSGHEVLSSHPVAERARWRRRTCVVVTALTTMLAVSLAVHEARTADQSAASGTSGPNQSYAKSSPDLVALIRSRCPHVRRLRLVDVDTVASVDIAPCSAARRRGPYATCSQDAASVRFVRIASVRSGTEGRLDEGRLDGWVEVRPPTGRARCGTPPRCR